MEVRAVFLVGFMACGKSTVGQELARRLDWDFVDLDERIEWRERQTISEIFRQRGEEGFRLAETSALCDLTDSLERDTVIALGGGTFAHAQNRELLRSWPSIFLDTPIDELWRRSMKDAGKRPLRSDRAEFARLLESRLPFYRQATVTVVTSGKDQTSLCAEIERTLQVCGKNEVATSSGVRPADSGTGDLP
ncbi:MAG: shikimate kinase [Terriglobales bacterium]